MLSLTGRPAGWFLDDLAGLGDQAAKALAPTVPVHPVTGSRRRKPCASAAGPLASRARARAAIARVQPRRTEDPRARDLSFGGPAFIRIFKEERELKLWMKGRQRFQLSWTYPIVACSGTLGPKLAEGDEQAPEGSCRVAASRMNPNRRFLLAFNLGYPNAHDQVHGRTGSALMVHGGSVSIGCFAMTDEKIEETYALADAALRAGQPVFAVYCFPLRMTADSMARHEKDPWYGFWVNLKEGCDRFEHSGEPPEVTVEGKRYAFGEAASDRTAAAPR